MGRKRKKIYLLFQFRNFGCSGVFFQFIGRTVCPIDLGSIIFFADVQIMLYQKKLYIKQLRSYEEKMFHIPPVGAIKLRNEQTKFEDEKKVFFLSRF